MQEFINWLVDNWKFVSTVAVSIITFILLLVFKRQKCVIIDDGFYNEALRLVIEAEALYGSGHGKEKLDYVISTMQSRHPYGKVLSGFDVMVKSVVDDILTSPQKKEK